MKISTEKREFLTRITGGLGVLMDCSMMSEEIYAAQEDEIELYIKNNLLSGSSFDDKKFVALVNTMDDTILEKLLEFFDDSDMELHNAYHASCIPCEDDYFSMAIEQGEIYSFSDFLVL